MAVNEEKRLKFMENAGKRVNKVMHDIQILEPMARSASYDFTKQDVEEMFAAMQETLNNAKIEFEKKLEDPIFLEKMKMEEKIIENLDLRSMLDEWRLEEERKAYEHLMKM